MGKIRKEDVDGVLVEGVKATVRRGGNIHLQIASLKDVSAAYDEDGNEVHSRDEVMLRMQLAQVDALRAAGLPARINNIRPVEVEGGDTYFAFSWSIWVNQPDSQRPSANGGNTAKLEAKLQQMSSVMERLLALVPAEKLAEMQEGTSAETEAPI